MDLVAPAVKFLVEREDSGNILLAIEHPLMEEIIGKKILFIRMNDDCARGLAGSVALVESGQERWAFYESDIQIQGTEAQDPLTN